METTVETLRKARQIADLFKDGNSKFTYACVKGIKLIDKTLEKYNEELDNKKNELASVDDKKNIVFNDKGGYVFNQDSSKKLNDFINKQNKEIVQYLNPYYAKDFTEIANNLFLLDSVNGILIEEINLEEYVSNKEKK